MVKNISYSHAASLPTLGRHQLRPVALTPLRSTAPRTFPVHRQLQLQKRPQRRPAAVYMSASTSAISSVPVHAPALPVQLAAAVVSMWQRLVDGFGAAMQRAAVATQSAETQQVHFVTNSE